MGLLFSACVHDLSVLGYDSDDECDDDDVHYTRRNRGKYYTQLAKDDSQDHTTRNQYSDNDTSQLRVDSVSMYGDTNSYMFTQDSHSDRRNSESLASSEDFNSDSDITTKHAYIHPRKEGGLTLFHSDFHMSQ